MGQQLMGILLIQQKSHADNHDLSLKNGPQILSFIFLKSSNTKKARNHAFIGA